MGTLTELVKSPTWACPLVSRSRHDPRLLPGRLCPRAAIRL